MRRSQRRRVFVSDCEGPISKNDNAFEITSHFLPDGDQFFSLLSRYDDVLADLVKRPRYRAGYTLKLITPFLKAYGMTNRKVEQYSAENVSLIHGAKEMLQRVRDTMPSFIVSTSYEQYISSLCTLIGFPYENVYCTQLDLDKYSIGKAEIKRITELQQEICALPMIEIPTGAQSIDQLSCQSRDTVKRLDRIFWEEITSMKIGKMLEEVKPIGGGEKADSLRDIARRTDCDLDAIMYIGDSITDVQAFQLVRNSGGLTVSFNGNQYAVRSAEVVVLSKDAIITSALADVFSRLGKERVLKLVEAWSHDELKKYFSDQTLIQTILDTYPEVLPQVELVTKDNVNTLAEVSSSFRQTVRGEAIGTLG